MKKNTSLLLHSVQASCTVSSDFPYTGLNTENHIGTENAFLITADVNRKSLL